MVSSQVVDKGELYLVFLKLLNSSYYCEYLLVGTTKKEVIVGVLAICFKKLYSCLIQ